MAGFFKCCLPPEKAVERESPTASRMPPFADRSKSVVVMTTLTIISTAAVVAA